MIRLLQRVSQLLFLFLFILFFILGKTQVWMGLFLLGILASLILGRFYCGWGCSINTVLKFVTWTKKKLHIRDIKIPKFIKKPWVRYFSLGLFIALFVFTLITGKKLPVLPAMFLIAVLFSFLFPEELWHHYLCPYGKVLSLPSNKSIYGMSIDKDKCISCGVCKRTCPTNAIENTENIYMIIKNECLICLDCSEKCPEEAIAYKKI